MTWNQFLISLNEKSPKAAQNLIETILARSIQLETFPLSGTKTIQSQVTAKIDYYYLVQSHYRIYYKPEKDVIFIVAVVDTRKDPDNIKY